MLLLLRLLPPRPPPRARRPHPRPRPLPQPDGGGGGQPVGASLDDLNRALDAALARGSAAGRAARSAPPSVALVRPPRRARAAAPP